MISIDDTAAFWFAAPISGADRPSGRRPLGGSQDVRKPCCTRSYDVFRDMVHAGRPEVQFVPGVEASRRRIPSPRLGARPARLPRVCRRRAARRLRRPLAAHRADHRHAAVPGLSGAAAGGRGRDGGDRARALPRRGARSRGGQLQRHRGARAGTRSGSRRGGTWCTTTGTAAPGSASRGAARRACWRSSGLSSRATGSGRAGRRTPRRAGGPPPPGPARPDRGR
jgi:hypothetical protein